MSRQTSAPGMSGRPRSSTMSAGRSAAARSSPSRPDAASSTRPCSASSACRTTRRICGSSSITSIVGSGPAMSKDGATAIEWKAERGPPAGLPSRLSREYFPGSCRRHCRGPSPPEPRRRHPTRPASSSAMILLAHSYFLRDDAKQLARMKPYPPLATLLAASVLRERGHDVTLFDAMLADGVDAFRAALAAAEPGVVAIVEDSFNYITKMCTVRLREATIEMIAAARARG